MTAAASDQSAAARAAVTAALSLLVRAAGDEYGSPGTAPYRCDTAARQRVVCRRSLPGRCQPGSAAVNEEVLPVPGARSLRQLTAGGDHWP